MPLDIPSEADRLSAGLRLLAPSPVDPSPVIRTALPFYGASQTGMGDLVRSWHREHRGATTQEVFALADALWARAAATPTASPTRTSTGGAAR